MTGALRRAAVLLAGLTLLAGCASSDDGGASGPSSSTTPSAASSRSATQGPSGSQATVADKRPRVVVVSVDGLNPEALTPLLQQPDSAFARLTAEGAHTLNARTLAEVTRTLPNHTGMMTGRPVLGIGGTGVTFNEDDGSTLSATAGHYVPGIFDVAHDRGVHTALYAEKDKFNFLVRSWDSEHGAPDSTGADDGRDKIDDVLVGPPEEVLAASLRQIESGADGLVFLHLAGPDKAGHAEGFMSEPYLRAVEEADTQVAEVMRAIESSRAIRPRTTLIVTADHGGRGPEHEDASSPDNYRIPLFVWGAGAGRGDLYALNPARRDPAQTRPGYAGPQPVRNEDVANLALHTLGLPVLTGTFGAGDPLRIR